MSESTESLLELRLIGPDLVPGLVRSHELAGIMEAVEDMIASIVVREYPEVSRDTVVVGLSGISEGSIRLRFGSTVSSLVLPAFLTVSSAIAAGDYSNLPNKSLNALDTLVKFSARHSAVTEFWVPESSECLARVTKDTVVAESRLVRGQTTVVGRVLRVGGRRPRAMVETAAGQTLYCDITEGLATQLAQNLYRTVELSGIASWDPDDWRLEDFRIASFEPSGTRAPDEVIRELSDLVSQYFTSIEDVPAYVASLRSGERQN